MTIRSICAAVALALAAGHAGSAAAAPGDKAGVTASVRGQVQQVSFRTPQASIGRNVGSGDEVFLGDRIVTRAGSGVQIMLLDGTTFSIGPDASMVIDEFVYNPATNTGRLAATLTRGTLRVISGRLGRQDDEAIRVKLPQATVGIRDTSGHSNGRRLQWSYNSGVLANNYSILFFTPEPGTVALYGFGAAGLFAAIFARRRKRRGGRLDAVRTT